MRKNVLLPISLLLDSFIFSFHHVPLPSLLILVNHNLKSINQRETLKIKFRKTIVKDAKSYLGAKYKYGGKSPKAFDCSGLTAYVMKRNGIKIPAGSSHQANYGKRIKATQSKPGDLIFFGKKGNVNHVGIVVENSKEGILCCP